MLVVTHNCLSNIFTASLLIWTITSMRHVVAARDSLYNALLSPAPTPSTQSTIETQPPDCASRTVW